MSESATTLQPSPTAGPFTAAITGMRHRIMLSTMSRPSSIVCRRSTLSFAMRSSRPKSPPAEKARPAPVITATRASVSELSCGKSCARLKCSSSFVALSASGRDNVTMRTGPSSSTRITSDSSYFMGVLLLFCLGDRAPQGGTDRPKTRDAVSAGREIEDARRDDVLLDLGRTTHDALGPAVEIGLERDVVGVHHRVRARQIERRGADRLLDPGH